MKKTLLISVASAAVLSLAGSAFAGATFGAANQQFLPINAKTMNTVNIKNSKTKAYGACPYYVSKVTVGDINNPLTFTRPEHSNIRTAIAWTDFPYEISPQGDISVKDNNIKYNTFGPTGISDIDALPVHVTFLNKAGIGSPNGCGNGVRKEWNCEIDLGDLKGAGPQFNSSGTANDTLSITTKTGDKLLKCTAVSGS